MSWNPTANWNPEFVRILRISLPQKRAAIIAGLTLAILIAGGGLLWSSDNSGGSYAYRIEQFGRNAYDLLFVLLFALLFVLAPATAGLSFVQEKLRGTSIFQQMSLLSPAQVALGKFFGNGLFAYFIAALVLPFAILAAVLGGQPAWWRLCAFLLIGGLSMQAVGLFVSAAFSGSTEKALRGGLLLGPVVGGAGAIIAIALCSYFIVERYPMTHEYYTPAWAAQWVFYGLRLPAYILILGLLAFAGLWAFAGTVRRIKANQLIPISPRMVWLFFACAEAVLVGLLWGRHQAESAPNERLTIYLFLNGVALLILAGSSALSRDRLREWWSVERDPLTLLQRREIKNSLKTFLLALGSAEVGLIALWTSFQMHLTRALPDYAFVWQLMAVALGFGLTALGVAAFTQFCALHRFRIGGWAGIAFAVLFYVFMGLAGAVSGPQANNTFALINPLSYANAICEFDTRMSVSLGEEARWRQYAAESERGERFVQHLRTGDPFLVAHGLFAQGALALLCFGLARAKWNRTRRETFPERSVPARATQRQN